MVSGKRAFNMLGIDVRIVEELTWAAIGVSRFD